MKRFARFFLSMMAMFFLLGNAPHAEVERLPYWVFFSERDHSEGAVQAAADRTDPRALQRRTRLHQSAISDLDLDPEPVAWQAVLESGLKLRVRSRWLNAVSLWATAGEAESLRALEGVREVREVRRSRYQPDEPFPSARQVAEVDSTEYGFSYLQNNLVNVPILHEMGFKGEGVRIGFLDAGWIGLNTHVAFNGLNLVGTFNTHDSTENVAFHSHGTRTLSMVAADHRNHFIGVAPEVEVLLARTEDAADEYPAEEDYWVTGLEWVEANGADLVSSSLSYTDWYGYEDLDGATGVTTVAAGMAAARGLLVVNSAGNSGHTEEPWVGAPGDAETVLTVGAVDGFGEFAFFSSHGYTVDGRLKPDVSAMGMDNYTVDETTAESYRLGSGTSYSCPTVAGIVALMLQANPELTPARIIDILRATASQSEAPDTLLGWGIVDALSAVEMAQDENFAPTKPSSQPTLFMLEGVYPNPTNASAMAILRLVQSSEVQLTLHNLLGQRIAMRHYQLSAGQHMLDLPLDALGSGTYFLRVESHGASSRTRLTVVK